LASSSLFSLPHTTKFQSENSTLISFSTILSFLSKGKKFDFVFVFFLFLDSGPVLGILFSFSFWVNWSPCVLEADFEGLLGVIYTH
jgi:hypothetical protein